MATSSVILILAFCGLMIAASFGIGLWSKKKATTTQAYFGGTAMFGPIAVVCPAWQALPPPLHW